MEKHHDILKIISEVYHNGLPDYSVQKNQENIRLPSAASAVIEKNRGISKEMEFPLRRRVFSTRIDFPDTTGYAVAISSPEARAVTSAYIGLSKKNKLRVLPARMNLGAAKSEDVEVANYALMNTILSQPETQTLLNTNMALMGILSESIAFGVAITMKEFGINIPEGYIKTRHQKTEKSIDNPLGRHSEVQVAKTEFFPENIETLLVADSPASGLNDSISIRYLLDNHPRHFNSLKNIVYIGPFVSANAAYCLIRDANELGLNCVVGGLGFLLESDPEWYISPLPHDNPDFAADERDLKIHEKLFSGYEKEIGVAEDWSANFLGPQKAMADFEYTLEQHNSSIKEISKKVPPKRARLLYPCINELVPFSTYAEANRRSFRISLHNI